MRPIRVSPICVPYASYMRPISRRKRIVLHDDLSLRLITSMTM